MNRAEQSALYGEDPFPFGIAKNRRMLEMLFHSSHEQGLTQKLARIEDVFHPTLLDT
jgi:4,5-dihydroxyphthalate decarboxylase